MIGTLDVHEFLVIALAIIGLVFSGLSLQESRQRLRSITGAHLSSRLRPIALRWIFRHSMSLVIEASLLATGIIGGFLPEIDAQFRWMELLYIFALGIFTTKVVIDYWGQYFYESEDMRWAATGLTPTELAEAASAELGARIEAALERMSAQAAVNACELKTQIDAVSAGAAAKEEEKK